MMESFQLFTNTERVLQYTRLEQEPLISRKPTRDWPFKGTVECCKHFNVISFHSFYNLLLLLSLSFIRSPTPPNHRPPIHQGLIEFKNMSLYYDVNTAPALKNLNMTIEPGMKVGIVGRFVAIISFCNLFLC